MNRRTYIGILICVLVFALTTSAQDQVHLIPDRTSCVSGDTVWFNAVLVNSAEDNTGSVIHIQMDNLDNIHITSVSVVCEGNRAQGYLPVPDSLSTGVYVLKAYTNLQKSQSNSIVHQRFLTVYNRFESVINLISLPQNPGKNFDSTNEISFNIGQSSEEKLNLGVDLSPGFTNTVKQLIVTARLADPLADHLGNGWIDAGMEHSEEAFMAVKENNGIVVTGRIYSKSTGLPKAESTVLLSISDTLPYFDYCISDDQGRFYFYIRNAVGTGNLVLQELTDDQEDSGIELFQNLIATPPLHSEEQVLTNEQRTYATDVVKASYFNKFFNRSRGLMVDTFSIHKDFTYPFYGPPTKSFYPELFVDLDNFTEISREILRGVQFRTRKNEVTIRLLDYGTQTQFNEEPFKLLDGIPVLDPAFFSDFGTNEIKRVDAVFYKRHFGDLNFSGVLAIYSNHPTLGWVESMPGMSLIHYDCLQPTKKWDFVNQNSRYSNIPDFKKVLLREHLENVKTSNQFSFDISDIQADVIIEVTAIMNDGKVLQKRKLIEPEELNSGK